MPEWYKKRILQRPGQEVQLITERPSEFYQLELPDFKIPTVTNSEDSVMTGLENRKGRDAYNQAYNEYLEQHPISPLSGVGYNPYIGIQYNPQVKQQQAAHNYAVKKSGYIGDKSTSPYKSVDNAFGAVSTIGVSMIPLLGASFGTFGVLPKLATDTYFGYEGVKDLVSPEGIAKTVNFAKQGRGGRAILSGIGDLFNLTLARQGLKGIKTLGAFAKETPYVAKFNWMNRKGSFRMDYPWQITPETLPERLTLEHVAQNQTPKYNFNQLPGLNKRTYQSPSTKFLDPQSDANALRPFVLGRKPMYSVITKGYGHDAKVIEEADSAIGPDVIKLDYTRPITGLRGETYQQGMRFYVNPNKLKEVIGQFQDLYKARLRLPEHWNTNQIYNYIIQHPEKVDVKLGETPQDIVGLNLGFGIKDAMLFADGKLEDFGGVYKRTVPNWYAMLKKRLDSGNLKRDHGTFNGDHVTWKFNWGMMDDWARKQAPKMPLPETKDIIQTSPKNFASGITLQENVKVNDDIAKIAAAITHPGTFSPMVQYGLDKSKEIFTSPWMRIRLQNMGYSDSEIKNYIQDRLKQMDTSKLSIADDLENVHELTAFKNGDIRIGQADPVLIGENYNLLNTSPFNQAIIQATKRGDVVGTIQHEIAGHGTEFPGFEVDKSGNSIYDGVELTDNGIQATTDKKLDDEYYISPDEQRARYLPVAQQMYDSGFDPNSESDFYNFLEFHKSDPETTQAGQLAKYYNWKSIWPAFSKAHMLIPFGLIGLSQIPQNNKN